MEALRNRSSVISILNRNLLFVFILIAVVPVSAMHNFRRVRFDDSINYDQIGEAAKSNNVPRLISLLIEASGKKQKIAGELSNKLSALLHDRSVSTAIARVLIRHGAKVNHRDDLLETPLHTCRIGVADLLINHGAQVNPGNMVGNTPLSHAVRRKNMPKTKSLVAHGADIGCVNKKGQTVIDIASADEDSTDLACFLLVKRYKARNIIELIQNREIFGTFSRPFNYR